MPAVPVWSGSLDHQMNIGLPTMGDLRYESFIPFHYKTLRLWQ